MPGVLHFTKDAKRKKIVKFRIASDIHFEFSKFHLKFLLINVFIDVNISDYPELELARDENYFSIVLKSLRKHLTEFSHFQKEILSNQINSRRMTDA